jgi:hypothetical protein
MDGVRLGRAQGVANLVGGAWPLVHMSSFAMVFGPKLDRWLVKTVGGLLIVNGLTQLAASSAADGVRHARRLGVGTAAVLAAIDLIYVPARRISKMYLLDAAVESAGSWRGAGRRSVRAYAIDPNLLPSGDRAKPNQLPEPVRASFLCRVQR